MTYAFPIHVDNCTSSYPRTLRFRPTPLLSNLRGGEDKAFAKLGIRHHMRMSALRQDLVLTHKQLYKANVHKATAFSHGTLSGCQRLQVLPIHDKPSRKA